MDANMMSPQADLDMDSPIQFSLSDDSLASDATAASGTTMPPRMPNGQTPRFQGRMAAAAPAVAISSPTAHSSTESSY